MASGTFEAVNEDLRRQQEESRQKQLDQQRNQVFNGAKADVDLFASTKQELEMRIGKLQELISGLTDENELEWRRDQLKSN